MGSRACSEGADLLLALVAELNAVGIDNGPPAQGDVKRAVQRDNFQWPVCPIPTAIACLVAYVISHAISRHEQGKAQMK